MNHSIGSEDKFAVARRRLLEVEAMCSNALASARASVSELEEENRELRREALERRTEFYTEQEFAALLRVSESTIARLRKQAKLLPLMVGGQYRYSSLHVAQAHETFAMKARRRARHGLREAS